MTIPESIKIHRPTQFGAVEIRYLGGYFYVYQISSKWDPAKGRPQKVTGKSIGKITEADGFLPNANYNGPVISDHGSKKYREHGKIQ